MRRPSPIADPRAESFALLGSAVRQRYPEAAMVPALMIAGTDTKHFVALAEQSYRFTPIRAAQGDLARIHGTDERIAIGSYHDAIEVYVALLRSL